MSRSSQRTIVVVPSAPDSRVITPLPLNEPSWLIANRCGGSNSVIRDRVGDRDAEDPDRRPRLRADADRARRQDPDGLHLVHPARLALDVGHVRPDALDRRVDDDHRLDRLGVGATGLIRQDAIERHSRSRRRRARAGAPRGSSALTAAAERDTGGPHLIERALAVARLEVDRARWRRSGPRSRSRAGRRRAPSP